MPTCESVTRGRLSPSLSRLPSCYPVLTLNLPVKLPAVITFLCWVADPSCLAVGGVSVTPEFVHKCDIELCTLERSVLFASVCACVCVFLRVFVIMRASAVCISCADVSGLSLFITDDEM